MRILVTGANGFVGKHLCKVLSDNNTEVMAIVRRTCNDLTSIADQYEVDITDRSLVENVLADIKPDHIVHLAAAKNKGTALADYRTNYEVNLLGTLNLIDACHGLTKMSKFLYIGSCEEYGNQQVPFKESIKESPISAYGVSKLAVVNLLQALVATRNFPAVILRPSVVYGPGQDMDMFLPSLIRALVSGERFGMSLGKQTRDFLYIDDLLSAILKALVEPGLQGKVINISAGLPIQIDALAMKIASLIGPDVGNRIDFGAIEYRHAEVMSYCANNELAQDLLGWAPKISIEEGLKITIDYFSSCAEG